MADLPISSLYRQLILDHYRRPRNKGELDDASVVVHVRNPTCGDEIRLQLRVEDDRIADLRFEGEGCSISQASASMMTGLLKEKSLEDAIAVASRFKDLLHGEPEAARDRSLGDLRALEGVSKFPVRVRCAFLGFEALEEAVERSRNSETTE